MISSYGQQVKGQFTGYGGRGGRCGKLIVFAVETKGGPLVHLWLQLCVIFAWYRVPGVPH